MKKVVLALMALLPAMSVFAQKAAVQPKNVNFGIDLGMNYSALKISAHDPASIKKATSLNGIGYRLGLLMEVPISKHASIVAGSALSFYDNRVDVVKIDNAKFEYLLPPMVEFALHFNYKFDKYTNKPYLLVGPSYKIPLASNTMSAPQISRSTACIDLGIGLERIFPNYTLSPELRYSYGFTNISSLSGIQDAKLHSLSLIIKFKG